MRVWSMIAVLLAAITLQSTIFARWNLFGIMPDLILVLAVCYGLLYGPAQGLRMGLAGGLLLDLAGGGILGINTLTKALFGYGAGYLGKTVFKENILVPVVVSVAATVLGEALSFFFLSLFGWRGRFFHYLLTTVLPLSLYNILPAVPLYLFLLRRMKDQGRGRI